MVIPFLLELADVSFHMLIESELLKSTDAKFGSYWVIEGTKSVAF